MSFQTRLTTSVAFETELLEILRQRPSVVAIAENGTEHTHSDFVALLRKINTEASKFVRFAPDGVMLTKDDAVIHYDAKVAKAIEKDAYETYLAYRHCGCQVVLFVKWQEIIYWQRIEQVLLIPAQETLGRFTPDKRYPIDADGWIAPRLSSRTLPGGMSGTPYREIDFASMKVLANEKHLSSPNGKPPQGGENGKATQCPETR